MVNHVNHFNHINHSSDKEGFWFADKFFESPQTKRGFGLPIIPGKHAISHCLIRFGIIRSGLAINFGKHEISHCLNCDFYDFSDLFD